jgi:hypothetical protein
LKWPEVKGEREFDRVLSFGGGTQSSHLHEDHFRGNIEKYDYLVMSDVGAEPQFIHEQVRWWMDRQRQNGDTTPFMIARHNSMERGLEEMLMRYISAYTYDPNVYRESCSDCGQRLESNETFEAYGRIYCGPCYQSK